ncbi:MAG TPA: helix-turn-helix transcriptional regulator [Thermomicrobiales bacterium]|nr:helix-turn-helix transcriptional regulator [Thermomicrobiales bacterium]
MLATLVRAARRRRGWSQLALALRAGVDTGTINGIETGRVRRPTTRTLERLAAALELPPHELARAADRDAGGAEGRDG